MNRKKIILYAVIGIFVLFMMLDGLLGAAKTGLLPWTDKLLPVLQVRCLYEMEDLEASVLSKQKFCDCVSKKFRGEWKAESDETSVLFVWMAAYKGAEIKMTSKDRNAATLIADSDLPYFQKEILLRTGHKWYGTNIMEKAAELMRPPLDKMFENSKRKCVKAAKP